MAKVEQGIVPKYRPVTYKSSTALRAPPVSSRPATTRSRRGNARAGAVSARRPRSKCLLQPLGNAPLSVYGEVLTRGRVAASNGKTRAKKVITERGLESVRSMLPWRREKIPASEGGRDYTVTNATSLRDDTTEGREATTYAAENREEPVGSSRQNAGSPRRERSKSQASDQTLHELPRSELETPRVPGDSSSQRTLLEDDEGTKYVDYSNLFENPPPTIPTVDQYIRDESITYESITKRGQTRALPVSGSDGLLGKKKGDDAPWTYISDGDSEPVEPLELLFADEDIDKLLSFFDGMGCIDQQVTLEEMIMGFRKIRREWATMKSEETGRAVLSKLIRMMERAGMSLESWFKFMDSSQGGRGDGKLTAFELRVGFERLAAHIARRECCCRAYKCGRMPCYGFPPADEGAKGPSEHRSVTTRAKASHCSGEVDVTGSDPVDPSEFVESADNESVGAEGGDRGRTKRHRENEGQNEGNGKPTRGARREKIGPAASKRSVNLSCAGQALTCREHALEGMVYLGQRRYFSDLEDQTLTPKDIAELMRFVDTNVNFTLDVEELRRAIERVKAPTPSCSNTPEAGELLHVLEQYMHSTGARFTDVFFCIDRNGNGYIDRDELRALFRRLAREPAREKARVQASIELADERARQQQMREAKAHEAGLRLDMYKKAGVYAVLKRIDVWQARSGQRLSDGFHVGICDKGGRRGLDADELAAFMRNLDLDLSPSEAMLILRHLDPQSHSRVEVKDVASAVRNIRRDEAVLRVAQKRTDPTWHPASIGRRRPVTASVGAALAAGGRGRAGSRGGRGGGEEWEKLGALEGVPPSLEKLLPDGPFVFRPSIETITHGRASSAPAQRRGTGTTKNNNNLAAGVGAKHGVSHTGVGDTPLFHTIRARPATSAADRSATGRNSAGGAAGPRQSGYAAARKISSAGAVGRSGGGGESVVSPSGRPLLRRSPQHRGDYISGDGNTSSKGTGREASFTTSVDPRHGGETFPPWALALENGLEGEGGWWPGARSAVEDGARLDIFTGSILDGRWLDSLDSRLTSTVRATRR